MSGPFQFLLLRLQMEAIIATAKIGKIPLSREAVLEVGYGCVGCIEFTGEYIRESTMSST